MSYTRDQMIIACERGILFITLDETRKNMQLATERYLTEKLVSQVLEYENKKLIASVFNENGYKLIDRATGHIELINRSVSNLGFL